ncbi:hypothetical protein AVEN_269094-1 [Araneus ventricosus]|uniref:Uncharacterized protein n=1 Tax=Araneus ventricosus TaxID=182803 RepID=A0A4Y2UHU6_ARAVE|nr:hypothetical protein AVEN_269094-1 [Araneus ventricosus]
MVRVAATLVRVPPYRPSCDHKESLMLEGLWGGTNVPVKSRSEISVLTAIHAVHSPKRSHESHLVGRGGSVPGGRPSQGVGSLRGRGGLGGAEFFGGLLEGQKQAADGRREASQGQPQQHPAPQEEAPQAGASGRGAQAHLPRVVRSGQRDRARQRHGPAQKERKACKVKVFWLNLAFVTTIQNFYDLSSPPDPNLGFATG